MNKYLVTSALPYANGPLHVGHIAGAYLPADIFVRAQRLAGHDVLYICGTDEHGVPITITAAKEGTTPRAVVDRYHKEISEALDAFHIKFDNFSGTARAPHAKLSQEMFLNLLKNNYVDIKEEDQFFDEEQQKFLPDRYVEGTCPKCGDTGARGDQCDKCGSLLTPFELIDVRSALSGSKPSVRRVKHWYLKLQDFEQRLVEWLKNKPQWKDNVTKFILGWIRTEGLHERAITRSLDWGIPVPLDDPEAKGKVLYVWFDAPIGYISSTMEWAERQGRPDAWKDYWQNPNTKMVHFIGKDNIPFHAVIWPAILMGQGKDNPWILPYDIPANEYLNLEGQKISTSRNWAVWAKDAVNDFSVDSLRYAIASNAPESKDADFAWDFFQARNNDELSNIIGNLCNRTLTFIHKEGGVVPAASYIDQDKRHLATMQETLNKLFQAFEGYHVREACKLMMDLGREGNRYFDETKPWELRKTDPQRLQTVLNVCLETLKILAFGMAPILPEGSQKIWTMLGQKTPLKDERLQTIFSHSLPVGQKLGASEILYRKIEDAEITAQKEKLYKKAGITMEPVKDTNEKPQESKTPPAKPQITIEDFAKIDLRVAEIIEAAPLEKSRKLIKMQLKVGEERRQVLAGIKEFVDPASLVGRKIVIVYNLKPALLAGEESQGMLLAASTDDHSQLCILDPGDIPSGSIVR